MARFVIGNYGYTENNAGTKAPMDVDEILESIGFSKIELSNFSHRHFFRRIEIMKRFAFYDFSSEAGEEDLFVIEFPDFTFAVNMLISKIRKQNPRAKIILLIHDVIFLRSTPKSRAYYKFRKQEVQTLNQVDFLISHNAVMTRMLRENGVTTKCIDLGIFDYLYDGPYVKCDYSSSPAIVVAGNLIPKKSGYLYHPDLKLKNCIINAYGSNLASASAFISYKGSFSPTDLIPNLSGQYGLIWDGSSLDSCEGRTGNYLRYNNPHKFSLYISAGLPVIVWKESALAEFVMKEHIGICINSLFELDEISEKVSQEEYGMFIENILRIREKVVNGKFLLEAFDRILQMCN